MKKKKYTFLIDVITFIINKHMFSIISQLLGIIHVNN